MRIENNKLRNEIALYVYLFFNLYFFVICRQDLHIASLRVKKTPMAETAEKLESLRQKHEEIQIQEREFRQKSEHQLDDLRAKREQLDKREVSFLLLIFFNLKKKIKNIN